MSAKPSLVVVQPPHNSDLEMSVLGGIILHPEALARLETLEIDDFYDYKHKVVFEAMRNLEAAGRPIDVVTLEVEIERRGKLDAVGGVAYLAELSDRVPIVENILSYSEIVKRDSLNRRAIQLVRSVLVRAETWQHDPVELITELAGELERLEHEGKRLIGADDGARAAAFVTALRDVRAKLAPLHIGQRPWLFATDATTLLGREFEGPRWLVTGLITRGAIAMIGAEPKAAKTWLGTEIAVAVATGTKVCGEFFAEAGRVAYFYAEDRDIEIKSRVRALLAGADRRIASDRLHLEPRGTFLDVLRDEDLAWLLASCRRLGTLDLLVLDPLRDIHSGEEDKSDSMRDVMRRLRLLGELLGCTVAVVHHAPKSSKENSKRRPGQNLRGSSSIHGSVDAGLYLSDTDGDEVTTFSNVVASQVKGARSAGRFKITLTIGDNIAGEALTAQWAVEPVEAKTPKKLAATPPALSDTAVQKLKDDEAVLRWIRSLPQPLSRTALRGHDGRPIGEKRTSQAVDRLIETGQCSLHGGRVIPGSPVQMECIPSG